MAFHNRKNAAAAQTAAAAPTTETTTNAATAASAEPQTAEPKKADDATASPEAAAPKVEHTAPEQPANKPEPKAEHNTRPARRTSTDKLTAEEREAIRERRKERQAAIDALDPVKCAAIISAMITAGSIELTETADYYIATGDTRRYKNEIKRLGGTWNEAVMEADGKTVKEAGYWKLPLNALTDPAAAAQHRLDQRAERAAEREEKRAACQAAATTATQPSPFDGLEFWDGVRPLVTDTDNEMISVQTAFQQVGKMLIKALKMIGKTPKDLGKDASETLTAYYFEQMAATHKAWSDKRTKTA